MLLHDGSVWSGIAGVDRGSGDQRHQPCWMHVVRFQQAMASQEVQEWGRESEIEMVRGLTSLTMG